MDTSGSGQPVLVFNSLAHPRDTVVQLEYPEKSVHIHGPSHEEVPHQFITGHETGRRVLAFRAKKLPPIGFSVYRILDGPGQEKFPPVSVTPTTLENEHLKVTVNSSGEIVSLFDKTLNRTFFSAEKRGNVLKLYEDVPGKYEAWDIAPSYTKVEFEIPAGCAEVIEQGSVRSAIQITRPFRNSRLVQRIVLARGSRRIDFETFVDWKEQQKMLKVRFFTDIVTTKATYDIPFGTIERSAYRNNSFDAAKFEVAGHAWMDLSQGDCGLSLLNDCKYGFEAFDGMMCQTLLRGPLVPDPESDQEEHRFIYSIYPHAGDWRAGHTHRQALDLNHPPDAVLEAAHPGPLPPRHSFLQLDADNVFLEALKKAEKSDHLIIRLVERHGCGGPVSVNLAGLQIAEAFECNLLEREDAPVEHNTSSFRFTIAPYQIRTFKIQPQL